MKVIKLTAENVKRLSAVEITPDGNVVVISGRNGQGKTSVLDSIWFALGGAPAAKGTTRPIRDGEKRAEVTVDLGDLVVTRTWDSRGTTQLTVENAEGARYKSPQQMLDGLVGRLSFDPLSFAQQAERDQLATLLSLVDLPFDPEQVDAERRGLYEERTLTGREVKQLEGQLTGLAPAAAGVPEDEVDVTDLVERYNVVIQEVERQRGLRRITQQRRHDVAETERRLAEVQALLDGQRRALADAEKVEREQVSPPDPADLEDQIRRSGAVNLLVRQARERREVERRLNAAHARYDGYSESIAALDKAKADALAAAKLPVGGLGFDDDGVTFGGVPLKQCSAAEQLRVSLAMAMALNPTVRVIRITDGSLLDSDNMRLIEEMATAADFQVWIERVDESGTVGIVIEDGQVAA